MIYKYKTPLTLITGNIRSQIMGRAFAMGCKGKILKSHKITNFNEPIITYGILRGSGECIKAAKEYWYMDHGYFKQSNSHNFNDGYYRIVHNKLFHDGRNMSCPSDKFETLQKQNSSLRFLPWKKDGKFIVVSPPTILYKKDHPGLFKKSGQIGETWCPTGNFYGIFNWLEDIITEIKKYSNRPIIITTKARKNLNEALQQAHVFITDHSNAQLIALICGVPVITTNSYRKIGSVKNIENPIYDRSWLKNLAYCQWTISEIKSGQAWSELNELYKYEK